MTAFSTQVMTYDTGAITLTAVTATDDWECPTSPGGLFAVIRNAGASTDTIAFTSFAKTTGYGKVLPVPGPITVLAGGTAIIPLHPDYNNGSGRINVTHSFLTTVTCAIVQG